jgi:hypothetical protein
MYRVGRAFFRIVPTTIFQIYKIIRDYRYQSDVRNCDLYYQRCNCRYNRTYAVNYTPIFKYLALWNSVTTIFGSYHKLHIVCLIFFHHTTTSKRLQVVKPLTLWSSGWSQLETWSTSVPTDPHIRIIHALLGCIAGEWRLAQICIQILH